MFDITLRRSLVTLAVVIGLLFVARPAGADQGVTPSGPQSGVSSSRAHTPGQHTFDRHELRRRIACAVTNGWLDQRPVKVIARAFAAGNARVVNAIAAADPQVCKAGNRVVGSGTGTRSTLSSHTGPSANGIIAVLIGL
jgi:hypothetical protein